LHTRTIRVADGVPSFIIEDEVEGHGIHDFELNFQLTPNRTAKVSSAENAILCCILGDPEVQLTVAGPANLQGSIQPSLISHTYGVTVPGLRLRIWGTAAIPTRITTRISWVEVANQPNNRDRSANGTKSWERFPQEAWQV